MATTLECEELYSLVEDTFDTCSSNREEIYWLICLIRGLLNVPNERVDYGVDNISINMWQYQLHPIIERYKRHWHHSNY